MRYVKLQLALCHWFMISSVMSQRFVFENTFGEAYIVVLIFLPT